MTYNTDKNYFSLPDIIDVGTIESHLYCKSILIFTEDYRMLPSCIECGFLWVYREFEVQSTCYTNLFFQNWNLNEFSVFNALRSSNSCDFL